MPEGHSIHRYARLHRKTLGGKILRVSSPQGRFAAGAARLDGTAVVDVEPHGKHLFYRWSNGETLHVHLGLFGRFRTFRGMVPAPTAGTRLAMEAEDATIYLAGPTVCALIAPDREEAIRARLGPDPLRRDGTADEFFRRLQRRSVPIGAALLDQKAIAGIGNVYRAEILFLAGISPATRSNQLDFDQADDIWNIAVERLRAGARSGRIVTVSPEEAGVTRLRDIGRRQRLFVYKRAGQPCRRCGTEIQRGESANRKIWWCPTCQAA